MNLVITIYLLIGCTIHLIFTFKKVKMEGSFITILVFMMLAWPIIVYMIYRVWKDQ